MITTQTSDKRDRLVEAAMNLAYRQGFRRTSLADIAKEARVPLGNVYYYFKTKEEIGRAVVETHLARVRLLQQRLNTMSSAGDRLCAFVQMTLDNRKILARSGCPIGTLCTELHKDSGVLAKQSSVLFTELLSYLEKQFRALGAQGDAHGLAVHLLAALEGIAVIAHSLGDPKIVVMEAERLQRWIRGLDVKSN
jgi:TetR/AcrR family transcriptional regulator, transcriptional repressor for nem operon